MYTNTMIKIELRVNDNEYRVNRHVYCLTYIGNRQVYITAHLPLFSSSSGNVEMTCSLTCDPHQRWRSGTRPF